MADTPDLGAQGTRKKGARFFEALPLYVAFTGTGVCCALIGVLLPTLLVEWQLSDGAAGFLFLLFWIGCSLGALLVLNALRLSITIGCASIAAAAAGFALSGRALSSPLMLLYGLGLGLTMTSISLLRQQTMHHARSVELVRLNLMWAVGAFACPFLMSSTLRSGSSGSTLLIVAGVFAILALLVLGIVSPSERLTRDSSFVLPTWTVFRDVPPSLILMTVLTTGLEASGGSWLATYAYRTQPGVLFTLAAPACLWAGLLSSRFLGSFAAIEMVMRRSVPVFVMLITLCTFALVDGVRGSGLLWAALLLGFGLGPLYPIFLARVMIFQQGGAIFFLAGVCSAVMPWMTGALSSRFGSLRSGLLVPAAGAFLLLLLTIAPQLRTTKRLQPTT